MTPPPFGRGSNSSAYHNTGAPAPSAPAPTTTMTNTQFDYKNQKHAQIKAYTSSAAGSVSGIETRTVIGACVLALIAGGFSLL